MALLNVNILFELTVSLGAVSICESVWIATRHGDLPLFGIADLILAGF
jgi:hypothetical protein